MVSAHISAEAQLSFQGLLYIQLCEAHKRPINNVALKQIMRFMRALTSVLLASANASSVLKDDPDAANTEGRLCASKDECNHAGAVSNACLVGLRLSSGTGKQRSVHVYLWTVLLCVQLPSCCIIICSYGFLRITAMVSLL